MATFQIKADKKLGGVKAYAVTSTLHNGKRIRQWLPLGTFPTKREAEREFNRVAERLHREKVRTITQERLESRQVPTLNASIPCYLNAVDGIRLNSSKGLTPYRIALSHPARYIGHLKLNEITPDKIEAYIASRRKEITYKHTPVSLKTVANEVAQLSALCCWAVKNQTLKNHPFKTPQRELKDYFPKTDRKPKTYLTQEEQMAILRVSNADPYANVVTHLLLYLGIRQGELAELKYSEVDLARREITVRAEKTNDYRILPIALPLISILGKLKTHFPDPKNRRWVPRASKHQAYLLCKEDGAPFDHPGKNLFGKLAHKAGVTKKVTPHVFRHTFVSNMRAAGLSPYEIMALTGHRNVSTLEGYGVNAPKDLLRKVERAYPALELVAEKVDEKVDNLLNFPQTFDIQGEKMAGALGFEPRIAWTKTR